MMIHLVNRKSRRGQIDNIILIGQTVWGTGGIDLPKEVTLTTD